MIFNRINMMIFKFMLSVVLAGFLLVACRDGGRGDLESGGSGSSDSGESGVAAPVGSGTGGGSGRAVSTGGRYQLTHTIGGSFSRENTTDSEGRYLIKE